MRLPYTVDIRICEMRISAAPVGRRRLASAPQFANADLGRAGRRAGDSRVVRNSQMRISPSPVAAPATRVWSAIRKCGSRLRRSAAGDSRVVRNSQMRISPSPVGRRRLACGELGWTVDMTSRDTGEPDQKSKGILY
nr:hypothetical protein Itr_chr07CG19240 [Ipomoea trifida]